VVTSSPTRRLGSAAVWPLAARAQQGARVRRIGVLIGGDENDPEYKSRASAFTQALAGLGWTDGRNAWIDLRWAGGDINRIRALAEELVGLQPDIIATGGTPATVAVQRETRTIPTVFAAGDASGIVPRPRKTMWRKGEMRIFTHSFQPAASPKALTRADEHDAFPEPSRAAPCLLLPTAKSHQWPSHDSGEAFRLHSGEG
jgi:ABC transporter substrate binding protein